MDARCHLLLHLELSNIFCVSLWRLCRNLQEIQLSLKFCYSLLGLEVDNTHTLMLPTESLLVSLWQDCINDGWYLLKLFGKLLRLSLLPVQLLGRLTQLVLDLMADKNSAHTMNAYTNKRLTHTCVYANILVPKQQHYTHTHIQTHTDISCRTCVPS